MIGTPLFMAPEQHLGEPTDARSDQFSFCVTLYRALYGVPPFAGKTYVALSDAVLHGRIEPAAKGSRVSARLRRIILRGLCTAPADRYPSMEALLHDLTRDPARALRRGALVMGLVGLLAAALVGGYVLRSTPVATPPLASGKHAIAVLGFKNLAADPAVDWISAALDELFPTELATGDELHVISAVDAERARVDLALPSAESLSAEMLARIRARLGVDAVVVGSYVHTNGSLTLVTVVEDAAEGHTQRFQIADTTSASRRPTTI